MYPSEPSKQNSLYQEIYNTADNTVGGTLVKQATRHGDRPAIIDTKNNEIITYYELNEISKNVAKALLKLGVAHNEHVAIWGPNTTKYLYVMYGVAKAGAPLTTLNPGHKALEMEYTLNQSDSTTLFICDNTFTSAENIATLYEMCPELKTASKGTIKTEKIPKLKNIISLGENHHPGMLTWSEFIKLADEVTDEELLDRETLINPQDIFLIQYTSGTTGTPKGALVSHNAILASARTSVERQQLTPDDINMLPQPFFHSYGCGCIINALFSASAITTIDRFSPSETLKVVEKTRATFIYGTPTMYIALLNAIKEHSYDLSSLRSGTAGGAVCPPEIGKAVIEKIGVKHFGISFGSTETLNVTMASVDDPIEKRITTMGTPLPHAEVKIIDIKTGETITDETPGELLVRSSSLMTGYYKMPQETKNVLQPTGWFHTGDLVSRDKDGYYQIMGRIKNVIIRGGENIYPSEVENFLYTHPAVSDAQVVAFPSYYYGEEPIAFVRLKTGMTATEAELKDYCKKNIAYFKVPIHIFFVENYPQTTSGKVQKFKLQEMAKELVPNPTSTKK